LTLARNLVQLHEGTPTARSDGLGEGSEFVVRLPHRKSEPAGQAESIRVEATTGCRRLRILVVEDNVQSAESLSLIVKLWGHECRVSHTGAEAIGVVENFRPHVVLLDIGLPGMDGYAVARELQNRPDPERFAVIAMTGYGRDEDRIRTRDAGFDHHMVKPVDLDALEVLLGRLTRGEDLRDPGQRDD
jgi:CheY-like chemotaxis protein